MTIFVPVARGTPAAPPRAPPPAHAGRWVSASAAHRRDPLVDAALEDGQRHRAFLQDLVELLEIELRAQRRLGLGARARPGHVADLVAARLPALSAVTLDLALRARPREAG